MMSMMDGNGRDAFEFEFTVLQRLHVGSLRKKKEYVILNIDIEVEVEVLKLKY